MSIAADATETGNTTTEADAKPTGDAAQGTNTASKTTGNTTAAATENEIKKKRTRVIYKPALNYDTLKSLEGTTESSFLELVNKVIFIDGTPFKFAKYITLDGKELSYKLTTGRKNDFMRMIQRYAILEFIGMKCYIVKVFDKEEQNIIGNAQLQKHLDKIKHS